MDEWCLYFIIALRVGSAMFLASNCEYGWVMFIFHHSSESWFCYVLCNRIIIRVSWNIQILCCIWKEIIHLCWFYILCMIYLRVMVLLSSKKFCYQLFLSHVSFYSTLSYVFTKDIDSNFFAFYKNLDYVLSYFSKNYYIVLILFNFFRRLFSHNRHLITYFFFWVVCWLNNSKFMLQNLYSLPLLFMNSSFENFLKSTP